jgi:hypothetical protein
LWQAIDNLQMDWWMVQPRSLDSLNSSAFLLLSSTYITLWLVHLVNLHMVFFNSACLEFSIIRSYIFMLSFIEIFRWNIIGGPGIITPFSLLIIISIIIKILLMEHFLYPRPFILPAFS